jgi:hypothetical protein
VGSVNSPGGWEEESSRLDRLEQELGKLKEELEKENRGVVGWAKKWGAVSALVVAIFAVPRGVVDIYHIFWSRPVTELVPGKTVEMGFDPTRKSVSFTLGIGVENSGTKDDFVSDWGATVKNISLRPSRTVQFSSNDIQCSSEAGKIIETPYPLHTSTSIQIFCTLENSDTDPFKQSGTYQIEMIVSGASSQKKTVSYCFDLGDKLIAEVIGSAVPESRRIIKNPDCQ